MEHRLILTTECGFIYYFEDGEFYEIYKSDDDTEYFGKIAKYDEKLIVIGGYKNINILELNGALNYDIIKIDMDLLKHSEAIKFIDDYMVLVSSSHNTITFIPVEAVKTISKTNELSKCFIAQIIPFISFKLVGIDFFKENFILGLKIYNRETNESGILKLTKDFDLAGIGKYGWKLTKIAVVDGKIWSLCNNIYKTDRTVCLVIDNEKVVAFHESYELNDFSVSEKYIYIVGRSIIEDRDTTLNRSMVVIIERFTYKLIDIFFIQGVGAILGCLSLGVDYANDRVVCNSTENINKRISSGKTYKFIPIMEGYKNG